MKSYTVLLLLLLLIISAAAIQSQAVEPEVDTPPDVCHDGDTIILDDGVFLAEDTHQSPVFLVLADAGGRSHFGNFATLWGFIEDPENEGHWAVIQPAGSVIKDGGTTLSWRGVSVIIQDCVLYYRYLILEQPPQEDA